MGNYWIMITGRIIAGKSIGMNYSIIPVYIRRDFINKTIKYDKYGNKPRKPKIIIQMYQIEMFVISNLYINMRLL